MTKPEVKPSLKRIEQKLDSLTEMVGKQPSLENDLEENGQAETERPNKTDCLNEDCKEELKEIAS